MPDIIRSRAGDVARPQGQPAWAHRAAVDGALLRVEDCELLFVGGLRNVYQHPLQPNLLIKTMRPDKLDENGELISRKSRRVSHLRQLGPYATFTREIRAMIRYLRRNFPLITTPPPFNRVYGIAETTHGMGLVVEKITCADGSPARTLGTIIREGGLTARHREQLDAFFAFAAEQHVNFGDLHAGNLVYEDKGQGRFVCIDGFGEKSFIPVYEWSQWVNRYRLRQLRGRVLAGIERATARVEREKAGRPHA